MRQLIEKRNEVNKHSESIAEMFRVIFNIKR